VLKVCEDAATESGAMVAAANINSPSQIAVSGAIAAVERAIILAKERGARKAVMLAVSAPFHCPLMQPARDAMKPVLESLEVREPKLGVIANVTAEVNRDRSRVVPLLLEQITAPVRWEESMERLRVTGVDGAIEFGFGRVLAGLMRRINKSLKVQAAEDPDSIRAIGKLIAAPTG